MGPTEDRKSTARLAVTRSLAYAPEGELGEYLLDEKLRIFTKWQRSSNGLRPLEAIREIRIQLSQPRSVLRLIGLSGAGKTRLAQALFDLRVGEQSLDPSLAIYANMADNPDPQPVGLISDLIAERTRAIVVIDNCQPSLHRRVAEICRSPESTVSALTIEYDIREDQPEGTDVFTLEPSSAELIQQLVSSRFPNMLPLNAHRIAEWSGGNARVGIALAHTVVKNDSLASFTDEELFERLFQQRNPYDQDLLYSAQACSLVYSFNGEDTSNTTVAELPRLAAMIGKSADEVFRGVAELKRRDLVQQRGVWRAVLPHAVANRLASTALQNIPYSTIELQLVKGAPERLTKSFARRLGYLHDSKEAVAIVEYWLGPAGLRGKVAHLENATREMLTSVAPAAPEAVLGALERVLKGADKDSILKCTYCVRLIRSLAYDATLFERCIALLLVFARVEEQTRMVRRKLRKCSSLFFCSIFQEPMPRENREWQSSSSCFAAKALRSSPLV